MSRTGGGKMTLDRSSKVKAALGKLLLPLVFTAAGVLLGKGFEQGSARVEQAPVAKATSSVPSADLSAEILEENVQQVAQLRAQLERVERRQVAEEAGEASAPSGEAPLAVPPVPLEEQASRRDAFYESKLSERAPDGARTAQFRDELHQTLDSLQLPHELVKEFSCNPNMCRTVFDLEVADLVDVESLVGKGPFRFGLYERFGPDQTTRVVYSGTAEQRLTRPSDELLTAIAP